MRWMAIGALMLLAACGPRAQSLSISNQFNPDEASHINRSGTASISGQAFLRTMVGEVRYAAGSIVHLVPASAYAKERFAKIYGTAKCSRMEIDHSGTDKRYMSMQKETKANGEGRFRFSNLAAGEYFLVTYVVWQVPQGRYGASTEGCGMYERVTAVEGRDTEIIMSGQ